MQQIQHILEMKIYQDSEKTTLKDADFTVEEYIDGTMKGYTVSKSLKDIDEVSKKDEVEYNLSGIFEDNASELYMFEVKKGLFKNKYVAKFNFDSSDSGLSDSSDDDEEYIYDDTVETETEGDLSGLTDSLTSALDLSFNVTLPYSAVSNNATTTNDDNKTLSVILNTGDDD